MPISQSDLRKVPVSYGRRLLCLSMSALICLVSMGITAPAAQSQISFGISLAEIVLSNISAARARRRCQSKGYPNSSTLRSNDPATGKYSPIPGTTGYGSRVYINGSRFPTYHPPTSDYLPVPNTEGYHSKNYPNGSAFPKYNAPTGDYSPVPEITGYRSKDSPNGTTFRKHDPPTGESPVSETDEEATVHDGAPACYARLDDKQIHRKNHAIDIYNRGSDLLEKHDYQRAQKAFSEALKLDPELIDAHWGAALAYKNLNDYEQCLHQVEVVIKNNPREADHWFLAADACQHLHNFSAANQYYKRFLKMESTGESAELAKKAVEIIEDRILNQSKGDYFAEATGSSFARWSDSAMPLKILIHEDPSVKGYRSEFLGVLKEAFHDWSFVSEGKIRFVFTENEGEAQITCSWTYDLSKLSGADKLGLTHMSVTNDGRIIKAKIDLHTLVDRTNLTKEEILAKEKEVALHEIGHALGLDHSKQACDIMYPEICPEGLEAPLTIRDKNTIVALYSTPFPKSSKQGEISQVQVDEVALRNQKNSP